MATSEAAHSNLPSVKSINSEDVISLAEDLLKVMENAGDEELIDEVAEEIRSLNASVDADKSYFERLLKDMQEKALICEQNVKLEEERVMDDVNLEKLHCQLLEEQRIELLLKDELSQIKDKMMETENKREDIEKHKKTLNALKAEEKRAQNTISLYASMTKIIPDLNNTEKHTGYFVDKEKKIAKRFEFDPTTMAKFDICNELWCMRDTI